MHGVIKALPGDARLHVHIAEQVGEVQDCLAIRGARPVEWLLANAAVDARWTLVHATHLTPEETRGIADSGATVAICPTTEANLGDGLFRSEEHTSELQSLMRNSYAVFCLKKTTHKNNEHIIPTVTTT